MLIITLQDILALSALAVLGVILCIQYIVFKIKGK